MKKILYGVLASSLAFNLMTTTLPIEAQGVEIPFVQETLGGPYYYSDYTQAAEYLRVRRNLMENEDLYLPSELPSFSENQAATLRAQALNRTVYHQILRKITSSSMTDVQKVKEIYTFPMYNFIRYDTSRETLPPAYLHTSYNKSAVTVLDRGSWLLATGIGGCQEFSTLFNRLMNTAGFPCFNVNGDYVNSNGSYIWHAFSRAKVNDTWYWYDVDVEGSVYRRGEVSSPIYFHYQKNSSYWSNNHAWDGAYVAEKEAENNGDNYLPAGTTFQYDGITEITLNGINYESPVPIYGFVDIDSDYFSESIMLLPFFDVLEFLGFHAYWDSNVNRLVLEEGENRVEFVTGSYSCWVNGVEQNMAVPIQVIEGHDYIGVDELMILLDFKLNMQFYRNSQGELVTVATLRDGKVAEDRINEFS